METQRRSEDAQRPEKQETAGAGEQHWGRGAASALARLRVQERAKAEERRGRQKPVAR